MIPEVSITFFAPAHQPGVDAMRDSIVPEFLLPFYHSSSPKMADLYLLPGRYYWVAMAGERVVGTVGVIVAGNVAILKSLFVTKEYRGVAVAERLLRAAEERARLVGCEEMYLGTMEQFVAAQRFYENHGFNRISIGDVPEVFPHNEFDVVFFKKRLI